MLHRIENATLILLLFSMLLLACGQIVMRNFIGIGITWIDPLLRVMVLWTGLLGATLASRDNQHIRIDLLPHSLSLRVRLFTQIIAGSFTALVCALISWHASRWVYLDYQDQLTAFAELPAWILEIIIPVSFALISLRYSILTFDWIKQFIQKQDTSTESISNQ